MKHALSPVEMADIRPSIPSQGYYDWVEKLEALSDRLHNMGTCPEWQISHLHRLVSSKVGQSSGCAADSSLIGGRIQGVAPLGVVVLHAPPGVYSWQLTQCGSHLVLATCR